MKYFSFASDCIDEDELRDMAREGGYPSSIDTRLWSSRDKAVAAMLEEINDQRQSFFDSVDDEDNPGEVKEEHLEADMYRSNALSTVWYIVIYEVQPE